MSKELNRADPDQDGITHINTHSKTHSPLGEILSPSYEIGEPIHHPLLGHFRTVENAWCYLNTGGKRDKIRTMKPAAARYAARLADKYSCDKFRDLILDLTLLKLRHKEEWWKEMAESELPFDHYFVQGKGKDKIAIRPGHAELFIGILEEVREITRGNKEHEFVRFRDMNFKKLEK